MNSPHQSLKIGGRLAVGIYYKKLFIFKTACRLSSIGKLKLVFFPLNKRRYCSGDILFFSRSDFAFVWAFLIAEQLMPRFYRPVNVLIN